MISPLAAALGAQLAVIAASKIRQGQATSDQPLLLALGHHTPTWAVAALDAAAATLVAWPLTTGPAATWSRPASPGPRWGCSPCAVGA